jgi:MazG family protein
VPRPFAPVVVPPLTEQKGEGFLRVVELMQRLLAADGCPWDREQTPASLRRYVLEEACEVIDAIDEGDRAHLKEELGDLLLQVVFLGELMRNEGAFGPDDIARGLVDKLVHRHPHVFADLQVGDADQVVKNWERIKAEEKKGRPLLAGVPRSLPALTRAQRIGEKVERVGFDWPDTRGASAKVHEEVAELEEAIATGDRDQVEGEFGDLLLAMVNLARHLNLDAEGSLRRAIDKFERRFSHVEARVRERHGGWLAATSADGAAELQRLPLEELDGYWEEAKRGE